MACIKNDNQYMKRASFSMVQSRFLILTAWFSKVGERQYISASVDCKALKIDWLVQWFAE